MRLSTTFYFLIFFKADTRRARACEFVRRQHFIIVSTFALQKKLYTEHEYRRIERLAETQNARITHDRFAKRCPRASCGSAKKRRATKFWNGSGAFESAAACATDAERR
jgi:hypothetical protein